MKIDELRCVSIQQQGCAGRKLIVFIVEEYQVSLTQKWNLGFPGIVYRQIEMFGKSGNIRTCQTLEKICIDFSVTNQILRYRFWFDPIPFSSYKEYSSLMNSALMEQTSGR